MVYVKVINGQIVEGPREVSYNESDSPNIHWKDEQLKLNNIFLVDLEHDPLTEKIDYSNPVITSDSVVYPRIKLNQDELTALAQIDVIQNREREYPPLNDLVIALWELIIEDRPEASIQLQAKREAVKVKYPKK